MEIDLPSLLSSTLQKFLFNFQKTGTNFPCFSMFSISIALVGQKKVFLWWRGVHIIIFLKIKYYEAEKWALVVEIMKNAK